MQPAQRADFFHLVHVLQKDQGRFFINPILLPRNALQFLEQLVVRHGIGIDACPSQYAGHIPAHRIWQIPTQLDIHTAPCHVGCNRYHPKGTSAGNNPGFLIMLAGIQNLVGNSSLQHL